MTVIKLVLNVLGCLVAALVAAQMIKLALSVLGIIIAVLASAYSYRHSYAC